MSKDFKIVLILVLVLLTLGGGFVWYRKKYPNGFSLGKGGTAEAIKTATKPATSPGATPGTAFNLGASNNGGFNFNSGNNNAANNTAAKDNANKVLAGGILTAIGGITTGLSGLFGGSDNSSDLPDPNNPDLTNYGTDTTQEVAQTGIDETNTSDYGYIDSSGDYFTDVQPPTEYGGYGPVI